MAVNEYVKKQLKTTAITGIPQIIQVRGSLRKLLKSVVFVGCVGGCIYQIWSFMKVYWTYPIIVDVIVTNPKRIALPAVTVCPYNGIMASSFCSDFPKLCTPAKSLKKFCMKNFALCRNPNEPPEGVMVPAIGPEELPVEGEIIDSFGGLWGFYREMGVDYGSFIYTSTSNDDKVRDALENSSPMWVGVFNIHDIPTNCYALNTMWGNATAKPYITSTRTDVTLELKVETDDNFYSKTPMAIQVAVHSPFEKINPFQEGFSIKPCTSYKIYVKMTQKYLLPHPYATDCANYTTLWQERDGFGPLSQEMCAEECVFNVSMERYSCFNPVFISYPNTEKFCFGTEYELDDEDYDECAEKCKAACYDETMQVEIEEFIYEDEDAGSDKKTCSTIVVFSLIRMEVITFTYKQKYETIELFGYIGGYLGMWLGMSLIAALDFLETCMMIFLYCIKRERRRKRSAKMKMEAARIKLPVRFPSARIYPEDPYFHNY